MLTDRQDSCSVRFVTKLGVLLQLHISQSGTSRMLFNTEKLSGLPKKIKALARREAEVSMVQQVTC